MDFYGINVLDDMTAEGAPDIGTTESPFGDIYGNVIATWGDLAEKYRCTEECEPGVVVSVSKRDDIDVEPCSIDLCPTVIGVVSTAPGYKMNNQLESGKFIGLTGLIPVKITGPVNKGDIIVPTIDGCGRAGKLIELPYKIGVANETILDNGIHLVNCIIK